MIPKLVHAFTVFAIDFPGMGWSDITPGASYDEPALRRAVVEFVKTLDLDAVTLAGESMGATVSLTASTELEGRVRRIVAFNTYDYPEGVGRSEPPGRPASRLPARGARGLPQCGQHDRRASPLQPCHRPVTLIYGDHDWSRIPEREANHSLLPGAPMISLPQTGHFAALEQPARVAEILLDNHSN